MKTWKLSRTDVCDCGERQTITLAGVKCAKDLEESIEDSMKKKSLFLAFRY